MAIARAAAEYVFADLLVKDSGGGSDKRREVRVELAVDKLITWTAVALPLLLISMAFAQEVSVGTQISCFSPTVFSWRQAAYVDNYCWAAVQTQDTGGRPLWLHKFFPYFLLLAAVLVYVPALFWRFTAAPVLLSDLSFIMDELDRSYNRAINLAKNLHTASNTPADTHAHTNGSVPDLTESFKYPIAKHYLKTKRNSRIMLVWYLICRASTLVALFLTCLYLCYYIHLSIFDEFPCDIRTGVVRNDTSVPDRLQCKLVAVGVFRLLSCVNLIVYLLLVPVCVYAMLVPIRTTRNFLKPYEVLPTFEKMDIGPMNWDDLTIYLLFLEENLNQLRSYKHVKVLEQLLQNCEGEALFLLQAFGKVITDLPDGKLKNLPNSDNNSTLEKCVEMKELSPLLNEDGSRPLCEEKLVRHRVS